LINNNSASASEIIAGCLQDQDRGLIIGSRSYGKGLVQEQYELSNGGTLRLTVSKYYTPSGRLIQKAYDDASIVDTTEIFKTVSGRLVRAGGGIEPDIKVADDINWNLPAIRQWMDLISEYAIRHNLLYHEGKIVSIDQIDQVKKELPAKDAILNDLIALAKKRSKEKSADLISYLQANKEKIYRIAESTMIAYRTGEEGWYRSFNATDPVVAKAKVMVKENLSRVFAQE
jgi:carboxyl-terminal processing protease